MRVTGSLAPSSQAFLLCLIGNLPQAEASLLCTVGNLASQAFLFVCFVGLQRVLGKGLENGFGQGFGLLNELVYANYPFAIGTRFSYLSQTKEHTLIHC